CISQYQRNACVLSPSVHPVHTVWLSTPPGLSQIPTSFIGSYYQGIHRAPLPTNPTNNPTKQGHQPHKPQIEQIQQPHKDGCHHTDTIITRQTHQPTTGQHVELSTRCSRPLYSYHHHTPPTPTTTQNNATTTP